MTVDVFDSDTAYGIRSNDGGLTLRGSNIDVQGGTVTGVGVSSSGTSGSHTIEASRINSASTGLEYTADTVTVRNRVVTSTNAIDLASGAIALVAYSQVGLFLTGTGTYECIGVYDSSMGPVNCP